MNAAIWEPLAMVGGFTPRETFHDNSTDPPMQDNQGRQAPPMYGTDNPPDQPIGTPPPFESAQSAQPLPGANNPAGRPPPSPMPGQPGWQPPSSAPVPAFWCDPVLAMRYILDLWALDPASKRRTVKWVNEEFTRIRAGK